MGTLGLDENDEVVVCFRMIGLPPSTLQIFIHNGYNEWTSPNGGGIVEMDPATWQSFGVPQGHQERLRLAVQRYGNGTFNQFYQLPSGSLRFGQRVDLQS